MSAGGFTGETADAAISPVTPTPSRSAGSSFPTRPAAPATGIPLTPYNRATFYGGEAAGYTDYPEHGNGAGVRH